MSAIVSLERGGARLDRLETVPVRDGGVVVLDSDVEVGEATGHDGVGWGFLASVSEALNLALPGDNGNGAVYLRDIRNGTLIQVSVGLGNDVPSVSSFVPQVWAGGSYVSYSSDADNLVAGDTNHQRDVFRTDTVRGVTQLISVSNAGALGDNESNVQGMTADGLHVVFSSPADDLVAGDTNGYPTCSCATWGDVRSCRQSCLRPPEELALLPNGSASPVILPMLPFDRRGGQACLAEHA